MSSKSCNVSFSGQHLTSFATFVTSSAEKVIVYLDKLDEARFNEHNTGVTFVSRGDTIKVEGRRRRRGGENPPNKQIFLTATCLSLIIRFLILLVIEGARNLITFSGWGGRGNTSSATSTEQGGEARDVGGGGVGYWLHSTVETEFCLFAHTWPPPRTDM